MCLSGQAGGKDQILSDQTGKKDLFVYVDWRYRAGASSCLLRHDDRLTFPTALPPPERGIALCCKARPVKAGMCRGLEWTRRRRRSLAGPAMTMMSILMDGWWRAAAEGGGRGWMYGDGRMERSRVRVQVRGLHGAIAAASQDVRRASGQRSRPGPETAFPRSKSDLLTVLLQRCLACLSVCPPSVRRLRERERGDVDVNMAAGDRRSLCEQQQEEEGGGDSSTVASLAAGLRVVVII
ncbi:hypothetical protein AXG93_2121s1180 [Marchantia polymorpha subsp. ruderalis]|uniref:Uncharacterized protein n=1 Tax=Marchantia polymorpha subsp. ruderalis TaxID=1480154 RepID=A0A176WBY3_MARPO|nr:hypothetical protein AXG93_2121s1180 [Marchantia polymorpha subsp. ruderalis]